MCLAVVAISLILRVVHRGWYYPGFDLSGSANGLFMVSRMSPWEALIYVLRQSRDYGAPFPHFSILSALVPGYLTALWPWEYWAHVVTLALVLLTLWMIARALGVSLRGSWVVLLGWAASPTLLSFSVAGFPWASAFLPHALALWLVLDRRFHRQALLTFGLCLLANELSWHVYELGKTVFLVFVLGALIQDRVPLRIRGIWLLAAALLVRSLWFHRSMHVNAYARPDLVDVGKILDGLSIVWRMLFVQPYLDLPLLFVAGLVAALWINRTRLLLLILMLAQVALVVALATYVPNGGQIRPRRFVMVDFYAVALAASVLADIRTATRAARVVRACVLIVLCAGNAWQLANLIDFVRRAIDRRPQAFGFTMPFVNSQIDYMVNFADVNFARTVAASVESGEKVLLVYNFGSHDENNTNPLGLPERLYVRFGHARFMESVFLFGSSACRHVCVPIRPMQELDPFLDGVAAGHPFGPSALAVYTVEPHRNDKNSFQAERATMMEGLNRRFTLQADSPPGKVFQRFRLTAR